MALAFATGSTLWQKEVSLYSTRCLSKREFWDHIQIAGGSMWTQEAESDLSEDACAVFWDLKKVN